MYPPEIEALFTFPLHDVDQEYQEDCDVHRSRFAQLLEKLNILEQPYAVVRGTGRDYTRDLVESWEILCAWQRVIKKEWTTEQAIAVVKEQYNSIISDSKRKKRYRELCVALEPCKDECFTFSTKDHFPVCEDKIFSLRKDLRRFLEDAPHDLQAPLDQLSDLDLEHRIMAERLRAEILAYRATKIRPPNAFDIKLAQETAITSVVAEKEARKQKEAAAYLEQIQALLVQTPVGVDSKTLKHVYREGVKLRRQVNAVKFCARKTVLNEIGSIQNWFSLEQWVLDETEEEEVCSKYREKLAALPRSSHELVRIITPQVFYELLQALMDKLHQRGRKKTSRITHLKHYHMLHKIAGELQTTTVLMESQKKPHTENKYSESTQALLEDLLSCVQTVGLNRAKKHISDLLADKDASAEEREASIEFREAVKEYEATKDKERLHLLVYGITE